MPKLSSELKSKCIKHTSYTKIIIISNNNNIQFLITHYLNLYLFNLICILYYNNAIGRVL